ncbi:O-antigen ligase family protein [Haloplanus rallus]|nr:O-antigen ligase family protein [Haloplanus rallus]
MLALLWGSIFSNGIHTIINEGTYIGVNRLLGVGIVCSIFVIMDVKNNTLRILFGFFSLMNLFFMTQTGGRGPLIAVIISLIFSLVWNYNTGKVRDYLWYMITLFVSLIILVLNGGRTINRLLSLIHDPGRSAIIRIDMAIHSVNLFLERPLLGHGIGSFPTLYKSGTYMYPHNIFLEILVESGTIGIIFLSFFIYYVSITVIKYRNHNYRLAGLISSLIIYSLINASVSFDIPGNKVFFIYSAMVLALFGYDSSNGSV